MHRRVQLRLLRSLPSAASSRPQLREVVASRWLFISSCTLTHRRLALINASTKARSAMEYSEILISDGQSLGLLGHGASAPEAVFGRTYPGELSIVRMTLVTSRRRAVLLPYGLLNFGPKVGVYPPGAAFVHVSGLPGLTLMAAADGAPDTTTRLALSPTSRQTTGASMRRVSEGLMSKLPDFRHGGRTGCRSVPRDGPRRQPGGGAGSLRSEE